MDETDQIIGHAGRIENHNIGELGGIPYHANDGIWAVVDSLNTFVCLIDSQDQFNKFGDNGKGKVYFWSCF